MEKAFTGIFAADSVVKTLVLCVLTIGAFLMVKLYRFSYQINHHTNLKISNVFIAITIVLFGVSLASLIYGLVNLDNPVILKSSIGVHLISSVFDVIWIIMVRNRINLIAGANKGDKLWLNPLITSIFHVIYMQYKINQGLLKSAT
ncbi:hypothetical protein [Thalassotalea sp. ND16A]|uniref:hypothetical protein n=1 Tax=Thalassotalea sp. ND16A TaxID=1535422 RepID=UPI00051A55EB|nr:hypothetical protein [Thalassotalea sp. ND16A]KGJ88015.1 hypothetical protein ND16A_2568 [Thalassotalea sp. ND16A]